MLDLLMLDTFSAACAESMWWKSWLWLVLCLLWEKLDWDSFSMYVPAAGFFLPSYGVLWPD